MGDTGPSASPSNLATLGSTGAHPGTPVPLILIGFLSGHHDFIWEVTPAHSLEWGSWMAVPSPRLPFPNLAVLLSRDDSAPLQY